jgi:hypothetical protein
MAARFGGTGLIVAETLGAGLAPGRQHDGSVAEEDGDRVSLQAIGESLAAPSSTEFAWCSHQLSVDRVSDRGQRLPVV